MEKIRTGKNKAEIVTQVTCLSLIAKAVGNKLAPFLPEIIPILTTIMMQLDEGQSIDVDNELSEACLTTIHSIIRRCPREVSAYVPNLFEKAMNLLTYDPNYTYNNDEEMKEEDDNGWGSDFEDD